MRRPPAPAPAARHRMLRSLSTPVSGAFSGVIRQCTKGAEKGASSAGEAKQRKGAARVLDLSLRVAGARSRPLRVPGARGSRSSATTAGRRHTQERKGRRPEGSEAPEARVGPPPPSAARRAGKAGKQGLAGNAPTHDEGRLERKAEAHGGTHQNSARAFLPPRAALPWASRHALTRTAPAREGGAAREDARTPRAVQRGEGKETRWQRQHQQLPATRDGGGEHACAAL